MSTYYSPGDYLCKIVGQGFAESKDKKTPFLFLVVRPVAQFGLNPEGEEQQYPVDANYERTVSLWLTDKTVERTAERLVELGWQGSDWNDLAPGGACDLTGTELRLTCTHELYEDKTREKWDFPYSGGVAQHDPKVGKKLNAMFAKALRKPSGPARSPATAARGPSGDDIPF
jgi:hypothetical protein